MLAQLRDDVASEGIDTCRIAVDAHGALVLAPMGEQRIELLLLEATGRFDVVGDVGLPQEEGRRSVGGELLVGEEQRVSAATSASVTMNPAFRWSACSRYLRQGSWPITTSGRTMRIQRATSHCSRTPLRSSRRASRKSPRSHLRAHGRCLALLLLTRGHEKRDVLLGVPRTLRAVGEYEVVQLAARRCPLGQRGATAELDVVGVRADRQRTFGTGRSRVICPSVCTEFTARTLSGEF